MTLYKVTNLKTGRTVEMSKNGVEALKRHSNWKQKYDITSGPKVTNVPEVPTVDTNNDGKRSAKEVISAIEAADTVEAVNTLIDGDKRKTVVQAAKARINELS